MKQGYHVITKKQGGRAFGLALLLLLLCALVFTGCALLDPRDDGSDDGSVAVTSVTLNKTSITMGVGDRATVTATLMPTIATDKTVTWTSSDESVATVESGKVKAVGVGTATITATAASGESATCQVTVKAVLEGVSFISKTLSYNGEEQSIYISGDLPDGVSVTYTGNGKSAVGRHAVTAHFEDATNTYILPDDMTAVMNIVKDGAFVDVIFHFENGSTQKLTVASGTDITAQLPLIPSKAGYTGSWSYKGAVSADMDVYLSYKANTYTVTYLPNGGNGDPVVRNVSYGGNITLPATPPTRTGYTFTGYTYRGAAFTGGRFEYLENIEVLAQWSPKKYTVRYFVGTVMVFSEQATFDANYTWKATDSNVLYWKRGNEMLAAGDSAKWTWTEGIDLYAINVCADTTFSYTLSGKNATITGYNGSATALVIPDYVLSSGTLYPVTAIAARAFKNGTFSTAYVPAGVLSIGTDAFSSCKQMTAISLPAGLTTIGVQCFHNCTKLVNVTIPASVTTLEYSAFYGCELLESVIFESGSQLQSLSDWLFKSCAKLNGIVLPATITAVGKEVFNSCTSLTALTVPSGVTSFGTNVFTGCTSLSELTVPFVGATLGGTENTHFGYFFGASDATNNAITVPASLTKVMVTGQCVFGAEDMSGTTFELVLHHVWGDTWLPDTAGHYHPCTRTGCKVGGERVPHFYDENNTCELCGYVTTGLFFLYDVLEKTYTVTGYNGTDTVVVIPAVHQGYPVVAVAANAFKSNTTIQSVTVPSSVKSLGTDAFRYCSALTTVTLAEGLESIGYQCFHQCTSLAAIRIPASVTTLGESVFHSCSSLVEATFATGSKLTAIPKYLFRYCAKLESLTLPNKITSIGSVAVANCTALSTLVIPSGVTSIAADAFSNTAALQHVTMPISAIPYISPYSLISVVLNGGKVLGELAFANCTNLNSITLPANMSAVDETAFTGCTNIQSANVPVVAFSALPRTALKHLTVSGIGNIPDESFYGCATLETLTIGSGINRIGTRAFRGCSKLWQINLSEGLTQMGGECFMLCSPIAVTIPGSVTSWGNSIFYNCYTLERVTIGAGSKITSISGWSFRACHALQSINIPETVTSIGTHAFWNCYSLADVRIPTGVTSIGENAFVYNKFTAIALPTNLTSLGAGAFDNCRYLKSITIPAGVTTIGNNTFRNCTSLTTVNFASKTRLTSIGDRAFAYCSALESIQLSTALKTVGKSAFYWCRNLKTVNATNLAKYLGIEFANDEANPLAGGASLYVDGQLLTELVLPTTITEIKSYAFYGYGALTSVTLPSNFKTIGKGAFGKCDALTAVNIPTLETWFHISFADAKANPLAVGARLYTANGTSYEKVGTQITLPATVTKVSPFAFYGCDWLTGVNVTDLAAFAQIDFGNFYANPLYYAKKLYLNGTEVTALSVPAGVSKIGNYAFVNGSFSSVTLPASVKSVGANAFNNVTMTSLEGAPETLYYNSFAYCNSLNSITVPADMIRYLPKNAVKTVVISGGTSIPAEAFKGCTKLTSITVPASITHIGVDAFSGCTSLTNVYITDMAAWCAIDFDSATANPLSCGANLYLNGSKVTNLSLPAGVTEISDFAFTGCKSITSVNLGANVTSIGFKSFAGCSSLTSVSAASTYTLCGSGALSGISPTAANLKSTYAAYWWQK